MIYLASDHRGFQLKEKIKVWLKEWNYEYEDMGNFVYEENDDYPDFISKAAGAVANDPNRNKGIILGGSGQGEAMVANRYKDVRAAVFYGPSFEVKGPRNWGWKTWLLLGGGGGALGVSEGVYFDKFKEIIKLSREHNNSNILSLGTFFLHEKTAKPLIKIWLETPFSGEERHLRRISKF